MIDSDKRIQYIIEYLSRYICKIDMSKKAGLFDNSVLFELFAIEVCKLWFNKGFRNLNINNSSDYEETLTIKDFENLKNINDNHSHNHNSVINMESKSYNIFSIFKMDCVKTNYSESN